MTDATSILPNADPLRPALDPQAASYQNFIGAFRKLWSGPIYRALQAQAAGLDHQASTRFDKFERALKELPLHQIFGWLEHNLQQMKYRGGYGIVPTVEAQRARLEAALAEPLPKGLLTESADLVLPDYYEETDFHLHPGGLRNDALAGIIYRESASASGGVVGRAGLHSKFAHVVLGVDSVESVLDLGCGFGRSTLAFASTGPEVRAVGVDLSAGCLRLAAHLACAQPECPRVRYVQADGANVPEADATFDLVTSTMLLHELPTEAISGLTAEAYRLLRPGGQVAHLDFLPPNDNFLRALYLGHSYRNSEPHMRDLASIDLRGLFEKAGFIDFNVSAFDESDGHNEDRWRLPWVVIRARKPA